VLDDQLRSQIIVDPSSAAVRSRGEIGLLVVSAVITVVSLACFAGAVLVWFPSDWLPPAKFFASVCLVLLGVWTRPRFARLPRSVMKIPADQAPARLRRALGLFAC
jgi:heat shock protein HtpX